MRKATLFVVILLAANLMAQTTNTATTVATYAEVTFTAPDGTLGTFFVSHVSSPPFFCDLSCTELGYSFCVIPVPGCREGFGHAPDGTLTASLTGNYLRHDKVAFQHEAVTNIGESDLRFLNVVCNAFDQYANCIDETVIPGDAGLIQLNFSKIPVWAFLTTNNQKYIFNGAISTATAFDDLFSAKAFGSVVGETVNSPGGGQVGFEATSSSTRPQGGPAASEFLRPQLTEAVRRRIELLELRIMK